MRPTIDHLRIVNETLFFFPSNSDSNNALGNKLVVVLSIDEFDCSRAARTEISSHSISGESQSDGFAFPTSNSTFDYRTTGESNFANVHRCAVSSPSRSFRYQCLSQFVEIHRQDHHTRSLSPSRITGAIDSIVAFSRSTHSNRSCAHVRRATRDHQCHVHTLFA